MHTATVFLKKEQQPVLEKYLKEKLVNEMSVTV
jgi:hypothetical protein